MKVSISAGGRDVEIETASDQNVSYADVADKALDVWKQTDGTERGLEGPAVGGQFGYAANRPPSSTTRLPVEVPE